MSQKSYLPINLLLSFLIFLLPFSFAQIKDGVGTERVAAFKAHEALRASSPFKTMQWKNVGPDLISGRCTEVQGVAGNRNVIFASFASGGFWKTENGGETWRSLTDALGTQAIGSFAVAPSNQNVIYIGTGEANIFRASFPGMGVFKSVDGGKSWKSVGLENTGTISRMVVHPSNPDVVYVSAGGNEWSYNNDRGVFKSENGGKTWTRILGSDEKTGSVDMVMDPSDPNT